MLAFYFGHMSGLTPQLRSICKSFCINTLNGPLSPSRENNEIDLRQALVYDFVAGMLLDVNAVYLLPRVRLA